MIIVPDSNIWLGELGLTSTLGAATRFYIKHNNARLALPEVVRLEVEHNFRTRLKEFTKTIRDNHRQLLAAFGALKEVVLPTDEAVDKKAQDIFGSVGVEVVSIPFSLDSARDSFLKTIRKVPPSATSQQFKDGVLWADCLRLAEGEDVCLVTSDTDFYADRQYYKGLAQNLLEEAKSAKHPIRAFASLADLLKDIKKEVALDVDTLTSSFLDRHKDSIQGTLQRHGFRIGQRLKISRMLYATERPHLLYIKFSIEFACEDTTGQNRAEACLVLNGDGSYNINDKTFPDLMNWGENLSYREQGGEDRIARNVVCAVGSIVIGHKEVVHTVRYQLDE